MNKKRLISIVSLCLIIVFGVAFFTKKDSSAPIRVGILHSLSGTMAISERHVKDTTLMAIEEINSCGGIEGRKLEPVVIDAKSDPAIYAKEAERLIKLEKVSVIFGCWTSAGRKSIKPIIENYNHLLFYPVQHEGLENSPNIIYTGAAPNQQIIPAVEYCFKNTGKRFFLIGSDYVFPRSANEIIREEAEQLGAEIVGEEYLLLGETRVGEVVKKILKSKPDIVFNTINGGTNREFFRELSYNGITAEQLPVMSFSIAEKELEVIGAKIAEGHLAAWNYFQSIDTAENNEFIHNYKQKYGRYKSISDPMAAAYFGVYLWAQAVRDAGTDTPSKVLPYLKEQSFKAPEGLVSIDKENNHTWRTVRIGKIKKNGQFEIVWSSSNNIRPIPYPPYKTPAQWEEFLDELYKKWRGRWAAQEK